MLSETKRYTKGTFCVLLSGQTKENITARAAFTFILLNIKQVAGTRFVQNRAASVPPLCRQARSLPVGESSLRIVAEEPLTRGKAACKVMFALAQTYVRVYSNVCSPWLKSKDIPGIWRKVNPYYCKAATAFVGYINMYLQINNMARIHIVMEIYLNLPATA